MTDGLYVVCEYCPEDDDGPKLGIIDTYGDGVCYECAREWDLWADDMATAEAAA